MKHKVFLGSSSEARNQGITDSIKRELMRMNPFIEVICWYDQNFFPLNSNVLDILVERANEFSFAVFIFSPDDEAIIRNQGYKITRDNVILELGLFYGKIGKNRCFYVSPNDVVDESPFKTPSDLHGITSGRYDSKEKDLVKAFIDFCGQVNYKINDLIEKGYLSGSWTQEWIAENSTTFKRENSDPNVNVVHLEDKVFAEYKAVDNDGIVYNFKLEGSLKNQHLVGIWYDTAINTGYKGVFHLVVKRNGSSMNGSYLGDSSKTEDITGAPWKWTKNNASN